MTDTLLSKVRKAAAAKSHRGRSEAYRWLRSRYRRLSKLFAKHEPAWAVIAQEMAEAGVTGGKQKPVTARALARIWVRVCEDEAVVAKAAKPRAPMPSSTPAGWKPQPVRSPAPAPVAASRPAPAPTPRPAAQPSGRTATGVLAKPPQLTPEEVEAKIEAMRERLRDRNR